MKPKTLLALMLLCCVLQPAMAQTMPATPAQTPRTIDDNDDVVKISTNLVQIDAVVIKDGKPVPNLTADDFEIYEDGHLQTITSFAYVSNAPKATTGSEPATTKRNKDLVPSSPLNRDDPRRTLALVVDDLGLSAESMGQVRRQLRKVIAEELQPNDLVAIIRTGGELGALQQFTNDKRLLNRAVDQLRWNLCSRVGIDVFPTFHASRNSVEDQRCGGNTFEQTMRALRFIIDAMGQLPGRKSMVLLSDSVPLEKQDFVVDDEGVSSLTSPSRNYSGLLQRLAEKAIRSSVVIYSLDTQGLQYTGMTAADSLQGNALAITRQINTLMSTRSTMLMARREGGELLARQTGGYQIRNSNSFKLDRILEEQSGYYLLGYRPTSETFNKRFHHIKAKVKRSGMTIRTRYGFFGVSEEEVANNQPSNRDMTNLALASPFRAQDIEVGLTSFFVNDKTSGSVVRSFIYLDARSLTFTPVEGRHQGAIEFHGVIFGDNGVVVEQLKRAATLNLSANDYEHAMRNGLVLTVDMPVKRHGFYQVRLAARDKTSSRIGSAGQFVHVPNLANKKLAVSGIVLVAGSAAETSGQTPARRFEPNSNLHFAYFIYNAANESRATSRNLVMTAKLFRDGREVYSGSEVPIDTAKQTDLTHVVVNGMVRLNADLEPGNYYLQVVITDKDVKNKTAPVVQWIDFEIVK